MSIPFMAFPSHSVCTPQSSANGQVRDRAPHALSQLVSSSSGEESACTPQPRRYRWCVLSIGSVARVDGHM